MLTLFTDIMLRTCAHEQIGVANINTVFVTLVGLANRIVKPVYHRFRQIRRTYESLRCLDVAIWRFS